MDRSKLTDILGLAAAKAAMSGWVLSRGFSHVSDDDYARVVIAQLFAHSPKLDPSGTSWLPFPFWITGLAMLPFGRTVAVARGVAFILGVAAVAAVYLALRAADVRRLVAIIAVVLAMSTPWNAWLATATVPEGFAGALIAAGAIAFVDPRARPWGAAALLVASLSRYEAWPVCATFAAGCLVAFGRGRSRRDLLLALVVIAGPLAWMAWNAHAHGSAVHFFARVSAYRQSIGAADVPLTDKLLGYPRALWSTAYGLVLIGGLGVLGLFEAELRKRWAFPLLAMAMMLGFLIYGDLRDGAPTHHPERALVALFWILPAFGADGVRALARRLAWGKPKREMVVAGAVAATLVAWAASVVRAWDQHPARAEDERREPQILRGRELRARGVSALEVRPCAYEHFALLASYGAPERAEVVSSPKRKVTDLCPEIVER